MSQEENAKQAVDLLVAAFLHALRRRETAVKVLLPDIDDSNSATLTAITMLLGMTLAGSCNNDAQYVEGIGLTVKVLSENQGRFSRLARKARGQA